MLIFVARDLQCICVYEFKNFAAKFFTEVPKSLCQSNKTFFSEFKHTAGGKLSATNYANTRAAHLIKHCVKAHHSSIGYHNATLHLSECTLEKKQYNKKK